MFKKLYHWIMREADNPRALWVLAGISFLEAFTLPVPLDAILAPMFLANKRRIWLVVAVVTVSQVFGGMTGYAIGHFFYEEIGGPIIAMYGYTETYTEVANALQNGDWEFVIIAGLISYEAVTITSGFIGISFSVFILASVLVRGGRFFSVGLIFYLLGPSAKALLDKHFALIVWLAVAVMIIGFIIIRWLY